MYRNSEKKLLLIYWKSNTLMDPCRPNIGSQDPNDPCGVAAYGHTYDMLPKIWFSREEQHRILPAVDFCFPLSVASLIAVLD